MAEQIEHPTGLPEGDTYLPESVIWNESQIVMPTPEHFITAMAALADGVMFGCACGALILGKKGSATKAWADHRQEPLP